MANLLWHSKSKPVILNKGNLKMLKDIADENEVYINLITVASLLKAEQFKK